MEQPEFWTNAVDAVQSISKVQLLILAVLAMVISWIGTSLVRRNVPMGRTMSIGSTVVLGGIVLTIVLQSSHIDRRLDIAMAASDVPEETVLGGETRVDMAPDGHFWLTIDLNGVEADFMVDTGATLTAISDDLADAANLEQSRSMPVQINTANGAVSATLVRVPSMRFGNINATGLEAVTSPAFGDTNVIGMNLLSQLGGWRVEGKTLILTPADSNSAE